MTLHKNHWNLIRQVLISKIAPKFIRGLRMEGAITPCTNPIVTPMCNVIARSNQ